MKLKVESSKFKVLGLWGILRRKSRQAKMIILILNLKSGF